MRRANLRPTEPSPGPSLAPHSNRRRTARSVRGSRRSATRTGDSFPDWLNAPVPGWGDPNPRLIIVGLAPGLKGANRTGRPFTGDYAGDLLYATLLKFGLATGDVRAAAGRQR